MMNRMQQAPSSLPNPLTAERINQQCACLTLDSAALERSLREQLGADCGEILGSAAWQGFFARTAVFLPESELRRMREAVRVLEQATRLPAYADEVLQWAPAAAGIDPGPAGAFMGYDFHLSEAGPKLIEINSNAGGAFLNAALARAQKRCCGAAADAALELNFETRVAAMFENEWRRQRGGGRPGGIAIVDDAPSTQYLYPEFLLARALLRRRGFDAAILDPGELRCESGRLSAGGQAIDLVYNRLVDFGLQDEGHAALRQAWLEDAAVITPNPRVHALMADKRNLCVLSDTARLREWGLPDHEAGLLDAVLPAVTRVTPDNAEAMWRDRRGLFFKPVAGHGSKGVYRGAKLTRGVFADITRGGYVAQAFVPPSERLVNLDGETRSLKVDVRLYTYEGDVLLTAARLYSGQATNFRTPGGGFAPIFVVP